MAGKAARAEKAIERARGRGEFNADTRTQERESAPVVIGGKRFKRKRKDWDTNREMRGIMRAQEKQVALGTRLRRRIAELEADQLEAAAKGETDEETKLETTIEELIAKADEATEDAELASYELVAALLEPEAEDGDEANIELLQEAMDVEDVATLARELSGSVEPDPQETPESEAT